MPERTSVQATAATVAPVPKCGVHNIPDCSPLLNGCTFPIRKGECQGCGDTHALRLHGERWLCPWCRRAVAVYADDKTVTCLRCEQPFSRFDQSPCPRCPSGNRHEALPHEFVPGSFDGGCSAETLNGFRCGYRRRDECPTGTAPVHAPPQQKASTPAHKAAEVDRG